MGATEEITCPKGHLSMERDYCSECGVRIDGSPERGLAGGPVVAGTGMEICPDCGTAREQPEIGFCEVCGYNFRTGAHGEIGIMPTASEPDPEHEEAGPSSEDIVRTEEASMPAPLLLRWRVTLAVDASLRGDDSPEAPSDVAPLTLDLAEGSYLIGRPDVSRGIRPEIAISFDEAVSRRHALLQGKGQDWSVRDIGAANGTRLNGKELEAMQDYRLAPGDEITLGHWTRLRIEAA